MRRYLLPVLVLSIIFINTADLGARLPNLRLLDPGFSRPNQTYTALSWHRIDLGQAAIHSVALDVDYGVNERLMVSLFAPYLFVPGSPGAGILGDIGAGIKTVLAQSDTLSWRLILDVYLRFPTGVKESDGLVNVAGVVFNYYPFSVGTGLLSPALTYSRLTGNWMLMASLIYQMENSETDSLIAFNREYDRLDFQLGADYLFKIGLADENEYLLLRPAVFVEYKQNLSPLIRIPGGFYTSLELNLKWSSILKAKIGINIPIYTSSTLHNFHTYIQLGKIF